MQLPTEGTKKKKKKKKKKKTRQAKDLFGDVYAICFLNVFKKLYVEGTYLNCIDKWVPIWEYPQHMPS